MTEDDMKAALDLVAMAQEPLHPDLVEWVEDTEFGKCLKHPLVYAIPLVVPGMYNRQYESKVEHLKQAIAEENWNTVVFIHERPWRLNALIEYDLLYDQHELVGRVWSDTENAWQNIQDWSQYFHTVEGTQQRYLLMNEDERKVYDALPDEVVVYRGAWRDVNEKGLSWTTDRALGLWFAKRLDRDDPVLLVGRVQKKHIIAYQDKRGEQEVIILPERVRVIRKQTVK